MDFNEKQILPPKNWETFEDLCPELFRRAWPAATAQKNGRRGQPQHGTDIWGTPLSAGGKYGAAGEDLAKAVRRADVASVIELGIQRVREGERESVDRAAFVASLRGSVNLVLEGEPGAGKSTTLLDLGGRILSATADLIPIYLPLPELVAGRKSILDEVAGRASLKPAPHGTLRQLASAGQIILFCDGWNEISAEQRTIARIELEKHIRDFSASSVLIATRALSPVPFGASQRHVLAPLTIPQQEAILVGRLGTKGADLLVQARRIPGLRDALQVPLYISALATIGAGAGLPRTKEEVVRRFIESHTQEAGHRDALANVLRGATMNT